MSINIPELTENLNIHQSLPDQPPLPAQELKKEWDKPANLIKEYINQTLVKSLNKVLDEEITEIKEKLKKETLEEAFPIGSTVLFKDDKDHSDFCGFVWQRTAEGKYISGYKADDNVFGTVGKTIGSETIKITKENLPDYSLSVTDPGHYHDIKDNRQGGGQVGTTVPDGNSGNAVFRSNTAKTGITVKSGGSDKPIDNKPLSEVHALWTRVS